MAAKTPVRYYSAVESGTVAQLGEFAAGDFIAAAFGGTGLAAVAAGDLLFGAAGNVFSALPLGLSSDVLRVVGTAPSWGKLTNANLAAGAYANITDVGVLSALTVSGNATVGGTFTASGRITATHGTEADFFFEKTGANANKNYMYNAGAAFGSGWWDDTNARSVWKYELPSGDFVIARPARLEGSRVDVAGPIRGSGSQLKIQIGGVDAITIQPTTVVDFASKVNAPRHFQQYRLSANVTNAVSATPADIFGSGVQVNASEGWWVEFIVCVDPVLNGGGYKITLSAPTGSTTVFAYAEGNTTAKTAFTIEKIALAQAFAQTWGNYAGVSIVRVMAYVLAGVNAGAINLKIAPVTNGQTMTVNPSSAFNAFMA